MASRPSIFHLAVPCRDLDEAVRFYEKLGCRAARRYADRVTFDFFGEQLVCHLAPEKIDPKPVMYPRHFGLTFTDKKLFVALQQTAEKEGLPFFQAPFVRFSGKPEEHETFFLQDPSNNLLEFKFYSEEQMIY